MFCAECCLPDLHAGDGDGVGSCRCPRCERCGAAPLMCDCLNERFDDHGSDQR